MALAVEASALALSDTLQVLLATPALGSQARNLRLCGSAAGAPVSRGAYIQAALQCAALLKAPESRAQLFYNLHASQSVVNIVPTLHYKASSSAQCLPPRQ